MLDRQNYDMKLGRVCGEGDTSASSLWFEVNQVDMVQSCGHIHHYILTIRNIGKIIIPTWKFSKDNCNNYELCINYSHKQTLSKLITLNM